VKLPRDVSGRELARRLRRFGYEIRRQTGSHMRLTSSIKGPDHHVTIPDHDDLRVGTLRGIVRAVAEYVSIDADEMVDRLFRD